MEMYGSVTRLHRAGSVVSRISIAGPSHGAHELCMTPCEKVGPSALALAAIAIRASTAIGTTFFRTRIQRFSFDWLMVRTITRTTLARYRPDFRLFDRRARISIAFDRRLECSRAHHARFRLRRG